MSKFKKGDRVRGLVGDHRHRAGELGTIDENGSVVPYVLWDNNPSYRAAEVEESMELITNEGGAPMARKTYKLIKDTPTMVKGAILQEKCDDGTQPYIMLNKNTHDKYADGADRKIKRSLVEDAPNWFVEVFQVEPQYMTREELDQWEAFKGGKAKKPVAKKAAVTTTAKSSVWTPARRKAHSAKLKASWAAKKATQV